MSDIFDKNPKGVNKYLKRVRLSTYAKKLDNDMRYYSGRGTSDHLKILIFKYLALDLYTEIFVHRQLEILSMFLAEGQRMALNIAENECFKDHDLDDEVFPVRRPKDMKDAVEIMLKAHKDGKHVFGEKFREAVELADSRE